MQVAAWFSGTKRQASTGLTCVVILVLLQWPRHGSGDGASLTTSGSDGGNGFGAAGLVPSFQQPFNYKSKIGFIEDWIRKGNEERGDEQNDMGRDNAGQAQIEVDP